MTKAQLLDPAAGHNRCVRGRHGYMLYNSNDTFIGRSLELYGEWAEAELRLLGSVIKTGSIVLDVGANIGCHSVFFGQAAGPEGKVLSFEPERVLFQQLCANIALNSLSNVLTFNMAAGASAGSVRIAQMDHTKSQNFGGLSLAGDNETSDETTSVIRIDDLGLPACTLIKVDVEGMELDVINGASATIEAYKPVLYVENNNEAKSGPLITRLLELGYHLYWHFSPFFTKDNYFGNAENIFGNVGDTNMLALPIAIDGLLPVTGPEDTHMKAIERDAAKLASS
jgi:FkbM family methyltransferase